MTRLQKARCHLAVVALAAGAALTGCAGAPPPADPAARTFSLGLIPGAQGLVDFVMEEQGILAGFGLEAERIQSLNPPTLHLMLAEQQVDVGFAGFTTMATARAGGRGVIVVGGVFSPVNAVFVPHDSAIDSIDDLEGRRLGVFGGPGSTTFAFLAVIARNWYGLNLYENVELVTAPGPALIELMARGDLDAVLLGTIESIQIRAEDRFRVLTDLSEEYRSLTGKPAPAHVVIATNEDFLSRSPDIVRDYLAAYRRTLDYIDSNPEVWGAFADSIEMDSPAARELLRERMSPNLIREWNADQIAAQNDYLGLVNEIIGESVLGSIPDGLIRGEFSP